MIFPTGLCNFILLNMQIVGSSPGFPHGIIDPIEVYEIDLFILKFLDLCELSNCFCRNLANWLLLLESVFMLIFVLEALYYLLLVNLGTAVWIS